MSHWSQSQSWSVWAIDYHQKAEWASHSRQSVIITDCFLSSTCIDYKHCILSYLMTLISSFEFKHTLNLQLLFSENIFTLISVFAQKLLNLYRDSSTDSEHVMIHTESVSVDENQRIVKLDRKKSQWIWEEDEHLKNLKTQSWYWWEIKQQFSLWRLSALQQ